MRKLLNIEYSLVQGTYWMYYGVAFSYAAVFLLDKGYTNSKIGIIFSMGSILALLLQPILAHIADTGKRIGLFGVIGIMIIIMIILNAFLFFYDSMNPLLTIIYILIIAWATTGQPFINSLNFHLQNSGCYINFGLARSMGSLLYALLVFLLGSIVVRFGIISIPITGEVILLLFLMFMVFTNIRYKKECKRSEVVVDKENEAKISFKDFIIRNKIFFVMSTGIIGLYFGNAVLNNFMFQIVDNVNGNSADMGRILSLMAALEIPTMVLFDKINKRFSCKTLIIIASIGFTVKILLCYLAQSVLMIFLAHFAQLFSFALFLPAMVHFVNEIMDKREAVRGQALFIIMTTIGSVVSSFLGGFILDISGASYLLLLSTIISLMGTLIIITFISKIVTAK